MAISHPVPKDESTKQRMQLQRRADTGPEMVVRRIVYGLGHRYRIGVAVLPGSPDLANRARRWAILVHGCYWHHHQNCKYATLPKHNRDWWSKKFKENANRDSKKIKALKALGFRVIVIWECETRDSSRLRGRLDKWLSPSS